MLAQSPAASTVIWISLIRNQFRLYVCRCCWTQFHRWAVRLCRLRTSAIVGVNETNLATLMY